MSNHKRPREIIVLDDDDEQDMIRSPIEVKEVPPPFRSSLFPEVIDTRTSPLKKRIGRMLYVVATRLEANAIPIFRVCEDEAAYRVAQAESRYQVLEHLGFFRALYPQLLNPMPVTLRHSEGAPKMLTLTEIEDNLNDIATFDNLGGFTSIDFETVNFTRLVWILRRITKFMVTYVRYPGLYDYTQDELEFIWLDIAKRPCSESFLRGATIHADQSLVEYLPKSQE